MEENKQQPHIVNHNEMTNCNVFMGDSYGGIFPLPGAQVSITQNLGAQKKSTQVEGDTETADNRQKRKEEAVHAICKRFDFTPNMLGYDEQRHHLTNERISMLFRRCLGMASIPPKAEYQPIMEQLWVLLIDNRNQCHKEAGEPYIRQTVLNLIGYFVERELICGQPREIARAIFSNTDTNTAKNITRNITSPIFPDGLSSMLDFYIDKLLHGEF